jgi:hypothetical protein
MGGGACGQLRGCRVGAALGPPVVSITGCCGDRIGKKWIDR